MTQHGPVTVTAVETAVPALSLTQDEVLAVFESGRRLSEKEQVFYRRFLADESIVRRHVACEEISDIFHPDTDHHHARFETHAVALGAQALQRACRAAGIRPEELDGLIVTTCTGYLCPGLSSYLAGRLNLQSGIVAVDMVGHGCGAAIPALRSAVHHLQNPALRHVAVVSVEICTAAIYWGDEIDLILSNAIFADGAAAAVLTSRSGANGLVLENFASVLWPEFRDELRFVQKKARLCNVISKEVPGIVGRAVQELDDGLRRPGDAERDMAYAFHTGGRRILDEIARRLALSDRQMAPSRAVLKRYGNMSSPSVFFVLKDLLSDARFSDGDPLLMVTFGAGFTGYGARGVRVGAPPVITDNAGENHVDHDRNETFAHL